MIERVAEALWNVTNPHVAYKDAPESDKAWLRAEARAAIFETLTFTAENGMKAALIGEFHEYVAIQCPECSSEPEPNEGCETCHGVGECRERVGVSWTTIKAIAKAAREYALPQKEVKP